MTPDGRDQEEGLPLVPGRATEAGTARFAARFPDRPGHFRQPDRLWWSSLALGTRRGDPGGADDLLYRSALRRCLEGGVHVIDTAHSDRMQSSERCLGQGLARAFAEGLAARDEVVVVTKGGQLVPDPRFATHHGAARRDLISRYVDTGLVDPALLANGHCIEPAFVHDQIERSRANLGLATLDVYLIEEPELHLRALGPDDFRSLFTRCLEALEQAVERGWIAAYGVSTWDGLLLPHGERGHLSLVELFDLALEVGGGHHHLRAVQLPYGVASGEGIASASQLGPGGRTAPVLELLRDTGTVVLASAPLYGGRVLGRLPGILGQVLPGCTGDAQRGLQFARSTDPVTSAVVGMRDPDHVDENLALTRLAPVAPEVPPALFARARRAS